MDDGAATETVSVGGAVCDQHTVMALPQQRRCVLAVPGVLALPRQRLCVLAKPGHAGPAAGRHAARSAAAAPGLMAGLALVLDEGAGGLEDAVQSIDGPSPPSTAGSLTPRSRSRLPL